PASFRCRGMLPCDLLQEWLLTLSTPHGESASTNHHSCAARHGLAQYPSCPVPFLPSWNDNLPVFACCIINTKCDSAKRCCQRTPRRLHRSRMHVYSIALPDRRHELQGRVPGKINPRIL